MTLRQIIHHATGTLMEPADSRQECDECGGDLLADESEGTICTECAARISTIRDKDREIRHYRRVIGRAAYITSNPNLKNELRDALDPKDDDLLVIGDMADERRDEPAPKDGDLVLGGMAYDD